MEGVSLQFRWQFAHELTQRLRDALERYGPERAACVLIQRIFRGFRVRLHLSEYHYYARELQRVYRGHLGRKRVRRALDARESSARLAVRHFAATLIQSAFKGCYSRKYIHDFHARKRYVAAVVARGDALREELEAQFARDLRAELQRREAKAREAFKTATAGLHHLVSTATRPGVYNPPWATRRADVPSAFGVELEVHLRAEVLHTLRTRGLHGPPDALRAATAVAYNGSALDSSIALLGHTTVTAVPAYASGASRQTLQATAPYDAPLEAARREAKASKMANLDQRPLLAGTRGRHFEAPLPLGVHATAPYVEPWLAARCDRETEHARKERTWVTGGVPFVSQSSTASRLFEDSERARAVRAVGVLKSMGALQAAQGAVVRTIRVGEAVLPAQPPSALPVTVSGPSSPSPSSKALPLQHHGRSPQQQLLQLTARQQPPNYLAATASSSAAAGSAVAAARAGRTAVAAGAGGGGSSGSSSSTAGASAPIGGGGRFIGEPPRGAAAAGVPVRKRPLMKPPIHAPGLPPKELLEERMKASVEALGKSFTLSPTAKR